MPVLAQTRTHPVLIEVEKQASRQGDVIAVNLHVGPELDGDPEALNQRRVAQARQRLVAGSSWTDQGFVFTTSIGTPLDGRNVLRWWHNLTEGCGVGRRRFHASRYTAATLMLEAGVPLEVISNILGHSGLAVTADIYAHVKPVAARSAADMLQRVLDG